MDNKEQDQVYIEHGIVFMMYDITRMNFDRLFINL